MLLDKDAILSANDRATREVEVPEWGGTVIVQAMTGKQRDEFEAAVQRRSKGDAVDIRGLKVLLVILTTVNQENEPLFTLDDADALAAKSGAAIDRIFRAASELNGLAESDIKDLAKN